MSTFAGNPAANGTVFIPITDTSANSDPYSLLLTLTSFSGIRQSPQITFRWPTHMSMLDMRCTRLAKDYVAECGLCGICWQNGLRRWFPYESFEEVRKRMRQIFQRCTYYCHISNTKVKPMIVPKRYSFIDRVCRSADAMNLLRTQ